MKRVIGIAAMALAAAAWGCQSTDMRAESDQPMDQRDNVGRLSTSDRAFISDAAAGGTYEVQASQLALRKSSDSRVRSIAQRMVDDHTKASNDLMDLCKRKGEAASPTLTADQQTMITRLNSLQGSDFDREFLQQQEQAHRDTIAKFQDEMRNGRDPELRDFAAQTLPTLQEHERLVTGERETNNLGMEK